jgi:hypothetical protein
MARHAGFGAAATATEDAVNAALAMYARTLLRPLYFALPTTLSVGSHSVTFAGFLQVRPPIVELHANSQDLITAHFLFRTQFDAQVDGQSAKTWIVELRVAVDVGLITTVQNNRLVVGIDTKTVTLHPLNVTVLAGPSPPAGLLAVLQSPNMAAAATAIIRSLPPLLFTPPLLTNHLQFTQPLHIGTAWYSNWFTVDVAVNRIVTKPLEKALTVAVDFSGFTSGSKTNLGDLTKIAGPGSIYSYTITPLTEPEDVAYNLQLKQQAEPTGGSISICVNMGFLSALVAQQISPQIGESPFDKLGNASSGGYEGTNASTLPGTPIRGDAALLSVSMRYGWFLSQQGVPQDGLVIGFKVRVEEGPWFDVNGKLYVQVYHLKADGPTNFVYGIPDVWRLVVAGVNIDEPDWVEFVVGALTIWFAGVLPMFSPAVVLLSVSALWVIGDLVNMIGNAAKVGLNASSTAMDFPQPPIGPLAGLTGCVSFTQDGIDVAIWRDATADSIPEPPLATVTPTSWDVYNRKAIPLRVAVRPDLAYLSNFLTVTWKVRRGDTNEALFTTTKAYNDPSGNGPNLSFATPALYKVKSFVVGCRLTLAKDGQTGDIWSTKTDVSIVDPLDRDHPFVQWGPHPVWFMNEGTSGWWYRLRTSRIHRTAVAARCKMLREWAIKFPDLWAIKFRDLQLNYFDELPFAWEDLNSHRKPLCEYCFFGGPDKDEPYPQEDWFVKIKHLV